MKPNCVETNSDFSDVYHKEPWFCPRLTLDYQILVDLLPSKLDLDPIKLNPKRIS